jgi:hypothetical protein
MPKLDRSQTIVPPKARPMPHVRLPQVSVEAQLEAFKLRSGDSISLFPTSQETKVWTTLADSPPSLGSYDILLGNALVEPSAHIEFFLAFDWASTELGPIDSWSSELRQTGCNVLGWEPNNMYNEPYVVITGKKHPFIMGKNFLEAWAEIVENFAPVFEKGYETGIATRMDDALLYLERHAI